MTTGDLIARLRLLDATPLRAAAKELRHQLERFSLDTPVGFDDGLTIEDATRFGASSSMREGVVVIGAPIT